jgi:high-affinity iron transporter
MLPSYLLALREGLEAALIIGIVLGTLSKIQRRDLGSVVWAGTFSALAVSLIGGAALFLLGTSFEGKAEQIFEGITMLLAASVLTWMIFWMQKQAQQIRSTIEKGVRQAAYRGGKIPLFLLAFTAILREGTELALFLVATVFATDTQQVVQGALLGLGTAVLLGWSLFATVVRLNLRRFFMITGALLILFAAGLVAHSVHEFNEVGWIPSIIEHVWDINPILDEKSTLGQLLNALFGYNANPSLSEVLAYLGYLTAILFGIRRSAAKAPVVAD